MSMIQASNRLQIVLDVQSLISYTVCIAAKIITTMQDVLYEVFETDADLLEGKLVHQGFSRDIAETKMCKEFVAHGNRTSYMLVNHYTHEPLALLLNDEDVARRGECQA